MPMWNPDGSPSWCSGRAGTGIYFGHADGSSITGHGMGEAGQAHWYSPRSVIAQLWSGGRARISEVNVDTLQEHEIYGSGASELVAREGCWAGFLAGAGVFDWQGRTNAASSLQNSSVGLGVMGPDGEYAIKRDYQSAGPWDVLERDGQRWVLTDGEASFIRLYGQRRASFVVNGRAQTCGSNMPSLSHLPDNPTWLTLLEMQWTEPSGWYVCYQNAAGELRLETADGRRGKTIVTGNAFRPDLRQDGSNIHVIWSDSDDEYVQDMRAELIDPATLEEIGDGGGSVEPVPPQTGPAIRVQSHLRSGIVAPYYSYSTRYGDTADPVGNAILLVEDSGNPQTLVADIERVVAANPSAILVLQGDGPAQITDRFWNQTIALWCSGGNPDELGAAVQRCVDTRPELPILAYLDGRGWPESRPGWLSDKVRPNLQAYRFPNEPLDAYASDMTAIFERVSRYGRFMGISPRFDDFNGDGSVEQTLECMALNDRWIRDYQLVDILPFADRRGNGMAQVPALREWAKAFAAAIPERPNRTDYWIPQGTSQEDRLRNKLAQSRIAVVFEPDLRDYIVSLMDNGEGGGGGNGGEPQPGNGVEPDQLPPIVNDVWAKYGGHQDPGPDGIGHMINEVAWRANGNKAEGRWMPSYKPAGNHVKQPRTGTFISWDVVQDGPTDPQTGHFKGYDVFSDSGPIFGESHQHNDPNRVGVAPTQPEM